MVERIRTRRDRFTTDEIADIFDVAASIEAIPVGLERDLSLDDLYRIGEELGISPSSIDAAMVAIARRGRADERDVRRSIRRRMRFLRHAIAYVVVVGMLAIIDALGGGGWWFFYVAGLWGIALALHALRFVTRRNGPLERRLSNAATVSVRRT
jgi:2TM domain